MLVAFLHPLLVPLADVRRIDAKLFADQLLPGLGPQIGEVVVSFPFVVPLAPSFWLSARTWTGRSPRARRSASAGRTGNGRMGAGPRRLDDPRAEPEDVQANERHRPAEMGDPVGDALHLAVLRISERPEWFGTSGRDTPARHPATMPECIAVRPGTPPARMSSPAKRPQRTRCRLTTLAG